MSIESLIAHARDFLAHSKTSPEERASAKRLLSRLLAKQEANISANAVYYRDYGRTYGKKYDQTEGLTLTDIAALIRADIKLAQKLGRKAAAAKVAPGTVQTPDPIGDAPKEIKIGVRTQYYSGGGSITITIKDIPADWGWVKVKEFGREREMPSPALRALAKELKQISDAYNHNGSDPMTDYYDVRFFGFVQTRDGLMLG